MLGIQMAQGVEFGAGDVIKYADGIAYIIVKGELDEDDDIVCMKLCTHLGERRLIADEYSYISISEYGACTLYTMALFEVIDSLIDEDI